MNITLVGGGNMASALIGGLLKKGWHARDLCVVDVDAEARARVEREFNVRTQGDITEGITESDCVLLAVKPQQMREVASQLAAHLDDALVITIAAGIRVAHLSRWLRGRQRIVRAMPNTPALVLAGVTGLYAAPGVSAEDRVRAEQVLSAAGSTLWVDDEERMDAVTAVSGSGPAYVFYFIEALQEAAVTLGLDEVSAERLALETFRGATALASQSADSVTSLRAKVTSKGGTTERALAELEKDGVGAAIVRAVCAAEQRSRELGDALGQEPSGTGTRP